MAFNSLVLKTHICMEDCFPEVQVHTTGVRQPYKMLTNYIWDFTVFLNVILTAFTCIYTLQQLHWKSTVNSQSSPKTARICRYKVKYPWNQSQTFHLLKDCSYSIGRDYQTRRKASGTFWKREKMIKIFLYSNKGKRM